MKEEAIRLKGKIVDIKKGFFVVEFENGKRVLAYLSGNMRKNYIKVGLGDMVEVELSPYSLTKGRIILRCDETKPAKK